MAEKKATSVASKTTKKTTAKKSAVKVYLNAENVGFRAGDVYQTLSQEGKALTVEEIATIANISVQDAYLGIGWLFKEGKVVGDDVHVTLA